MIENSNLERRHTLPRWLSIVSAIDTGLFARPGKIRAEADREKLQIAHRVSLEAEFDRCESEWSRNRAESDAEELISVAVVARREAHESVIAAANTVASSDSCGPAVTELAKAIASGELDRSGQPTAMEAIDLREQIRRRKRLLDINPRDALLLTEIALCHANLGQLHTSERLLRRALAFSPDSRFVLRSVARFLCHDERPDEALSLLRKSPRLNIDPWLKSAELAIAGMIGQPLRGWRKSRELAEDAALLPRDRSELFTEIATFEFSAGGRKAGLRQIRSAAEDPTENATAQVEFLAGKTEYFSMEDFCPDLSFAMEAQAYNSYRKDELKTAFEACEAWHRLEPFSVRPAIFGSFLSTARPNSIDRGIALAKSGLTSNPNNANLLNNLAVLMAYKGDTESAHNFSLQARSSSEDRNDIANIATKGLIHFRKGEIDSGRVAYETAIEMAVGERHVEMAIRAYAFFARELSRIDPSMKADFRKEFSIIDRKLSKNSKKFPRDVALIVTEFSECDSENKENRIDFRPFIEIHLDEFFDG